VSQIAKVVVKNTRGVTYAVGDVDGSKRLVHAQLSAPTNICHYPEIGNPSLVRRLPRNPASNTDVDRRAASSFRAEVSASSWVSAEIQSRRHVRSYQVNRDRIILGELGDRVRLA
jgi:hypothetical protein